MASSKLTQSLLVVIALLLTWLAIRPYPSTTVVHAAGQVQYKMANIAAAGQSQQSLEGQLNSLGNDGWVLVQCVGFDYCIFKK
jgi:hypothetical protein